MAVYTHLSRKVLERYTRQFGLGKLQRAQPIAAGSINSLYELRADAGRFALRVLENRPLRDALFEVAVLDRLAASGLPVAAPCRLRHGGTLTSLSRRQHVSVFPWLRGNPLAVENVQPIHVEQVGQLLAQMHLALHGLRRTRANAFSPAAMRGLLARCLQRAEPAQQRQLRTVAAALDADFDCGLPGELVHGDVFIDNVHFARNRIVGVLDFEMTARGPWLYDLAVVVFAWCFRGARLQAARLRALLRGYESVRALGSEVERLFELSRFAAARFALTRFWDFEVHPRPDAHRVHKDYREALARLANLQPQAWPF